MRWRRTSLAYNRFIIRKHGSKSEKPIDPTAKILTPSQTLEPRNLAVLSDFDAQKVSKLLTSEGFTHEQSEALTYLISEAVNESVQNMMQSLAQKNDQLVVRQHNQAQFEKLQSDINDLGNKFL